MIINCKERNDRFENKKVAKAYSRIQTLINEANKKEIPAELASLINKNIEEINSFEGSDKELIKILNRTYSEIVNLLKTKLGLVTQNQYLTLWMAIGMPLFGIPAGIMWGLVLDNLAFIGLGLPMGLLVGLLIGAMKDSKAKDEGRLINVEEIS